MKKLLLALPLTLLLTACGTPSVEDLIEDPALLTQTIEDCTLLMSQGKDSDTEACQNAMAAKKQMAENLIKGLMEQFGK